ncbi:MAG TPA: lysylphosphatidylglycerol synthase transmembrane domain-containing protein [Vicinamibacterales bacterium]|nr:lysylphosphatidylglycerol synthase transmembrane domain-containing protein [Vicinamibacterales bacterium]
MPSPLVKKLLRVAMLVVVLAATAVAIARSDPRAIGRALAGMSWRWATVAALLNMLGVVIDAMRLRIIARAAARVGAWHALQAQLVGIVGNVLFPFKLGEGARAYMLTRTSDISTSSAVKIVLADRIVDALVLPIFVVCASVLLPLPASVLRYRGWMLASAAVTSVAVVAVGRHRARLAAAIAASLASWTARGTILWCMLQAFGLVLPLSATVTMLVIVNLGIAIVATPGNVGSFELASAAALALWNVPADRAFSVGIATHLVEVVPPVLIGLVVGGGSWWMAGPPSPGSWAPAGPAPRT